MVHYPGITASAFAAAPPTIPTFIVAGTGNGQSVDTNPLTPGLPAGIVNGNLLIAQVGIRSSVAGTTCSTPAGWTLIHNDVTTLSSRMRQFLFTQVYAGGAAPSFTWDDAAGTTPSARSRIYAFQDASGVIESSAVVVNSVAGPVIAIPSVTTLGPNRLVVAFAATLGSALPAAPGHATGETGGDYTQLATGFTGGAGGAAAILGQSAPMIGAGTIANGVITIPSGTPNWVCRSFALLPA